jgi:hypothetical protein
MALTPTQLKVVTYGGAALLLWLLARGAMGNLVPKYTLTFETKVPATTGDNPAVDEKMRDLIDKSNAVIAEDNRQNGYVEGIGP